jgi:CubicO group peptidase (beta-lactamase class C family)
MTHTSGLANERARASKGESIEAVIGAEPMAYDPGTDFRYNNGAVDFLSVIVFAKAKLRLDDVLQRDIFGPMGVRGAHWKKDGAGHPMGAGELIIEPIELVKIGQLMLQDGVWDGKRLVPEGWVAECTRPSQSFTERYGMLWWLDAPSSTTITEELLARWKAVGVPDAIIAKVRALVGRSFASQIEIYNAVPKTMTKEEYAALEKVLDDTRVSMGRTKLLGPVRAWRAAGWMGQYMVIVPSAHLVALRMHVVQDRDQENDAAEDRVSYGTFTVDARALVGDRAFP